MSLRDSNGDQIALTIADRLRLQSLLQNYAEKCMWKVVTFDMLDEMTNEINKIKEEFYGDQRYRSRARATPEG
jgi:hypothetical protein